MGLPFGRGVIALGEAIHVTPDASPDAMEQARRDLENGLDRLHERAYALIGSNDPGGMGGEREMRGAAMPATLALYRAATTVAQPFTGALLAHRARRGKEDLARAGERRGFRPVRVRKAASSGCTARASAKRSRSCPS